MAELTLKVFTAGPLATNCYLLFNKKSKKGFLIDCPTPTHQIEEFIQDQDITLLFIALTHAHFDHIGGLKDMRVPFYIHQDDSVFLGEPQLNGSAFFATSFAIEQKPYHYSEAEPLYFERCPIEVIHTPGHTPGSVSLKIGCWLFSGDTLFCQSIGKTDIPMASEKALLTSIQTKLLSLPPETIVHPGHGPSTTIGEEKIRNPFLR